MKKIIALILAVLVLSQTGCSLIFPGLDESSDTSSRVSPTAYLSEYENAWCYQRLNERLQSGYREIYTAIREGMEKDTAVTISDSSLGTQSEYPGLRVELSKALSSREEAKRLYTAVLSDNPRFFYIGNTYSYEGYRSGNTDYYNVFCLVYTMNAQERTVAARRLASKVDSLIGEARRTGLTDQFDVELWLHDRLLSECTYETRASQTDNPSALYPTAFTAYGALVDGRAVCEGYARSMQLLLHRMGIECTLVNGFDQNNVAHMWNLVIIDGLAYHLDPTWDDNDDRLHHTYFNLTTEEIKLSHTIDADNIGVDTCTATSANYYQRRGRYLDTMRRDDIASVIAQEILNGSSVVDMRFSRSAFSSARLFVNNRDLLMHKVNSCLEGTGQAMWDYEEYNVNDVYYTLTIYRQEMAKKAAST